MCLCTYQVHNPLSLSFHVVLQNWYGKFRLHILDISTSSCNPIDPMILYFALDTDFAVWIPFLQPIFHTFKCYRKKWCCEALKVGNITSIVFAAFEELFNSSTRFHFSNCAIACFIGYTTCDPPILWHAFGYLSKLWGSCSHWVFQSISVSAGHERQPRGIFYHFPALKRKIRRCREIYECQLSLSGDRIHCFWCWDSQSVVWRLTDIFVDPPKV